MVKKKRMWDIIKEYEFEGVVEGFLGGRGFQIIGYHKNNVVYSLRGNKKESIGFVDSEGFAYVGDEIFVARYKENI